MYSVIQASGLTTGGVDEREEKLLQVDGALGTGAREAVEGKRSKMVLRYDDYHTSTICYVEVRRKTYLGGGWMELSSMFRALSDDLRRRVVRELAEDQTDSPRACGTFDLPITKASRTHHFKVLREAGLVTQEHYGNGSTLTLRRAEIDAALPGLLEALLHETPPRA